jgi:hypothetical protein
VHSSSRQGGYKSNDQGKRSIAPLAMIHKAKRRVVQPLTRPATAFPPTWLSQSLHMSQCRRFEPCIHFSLARIQPVIYDGVPMFHRDVSIAGRNNLAVTRLALVWAIDHAGA